MLQKQMKGMTMVVMTQMTQFMKKYIIPQDIGQPDNIQIEVDIVSGRAASPIGGIMLYGYLIIHEYILPRQLVKTYRKLNLGPFPHGLDFLWRSLWEISITFFLPCYRLKYPFTFESE